MSLHLQSLLERSRQGFLVLVASDRRLVRAACAEDFPVLNPEEASASEIAALLERTNDLIFQAAARIHYTVLGGRYAFGIMGRAIAVTILSHFAWLVKRAI
jgi:hypothetical protein